MSKEHVPIESTDVSISTVLMSEVHFEALPPILLNCLLLL